VDAPRTQAAKRLTLARAGLDASRVTYVPADLMVDDWLAGLRDAGFDPGRRSFFLWEAVTPYLDREAVERTLRTIAGSAPGSAVAFDYLGAGVVEGGSLFMRYARVVLAIVGERFGYGIGGPPPASRQVAALLESCGLVMEEHRTFGRENARQDAMAGFTTGVVPDR
jgi:methyltransferase (TIGR00027 family)